MNSTDAFFESFVNVSHSLLGIKLKPFSLLHLIWLNQIGSPLVITDKSCDLRDVELGALICSSSSNEEIFKKIGEQKGFRRIRRILWHRKNRETKGEKEFLIRQIECFFKYQEDYVSLPRFHHDDAEGESNEKLPWLLTLAASVIKTTGWSEDTVFSMPLGKLIWLNLAFNYLETGKSNVVSDKEEQAEEAIKALYGDLTGE